MADPRELGEPTIEYGIPEDGEERALTEGPTRAEMVRDIAVFQGKLVVDGLRDGMLMPVTLVAGLFGLVSKNRRATRMFYDVLRFGQRTERWINLFHPVTGDEINRALYGVKEVRKQLIKDGALTDELDDHLDSIEETLNDIKGMDFFKYRPTKR